MLLPKENLTVEEDGPDSVVDVVFVQDSSAHGCEIVSYQSLLEWPLSPPRSFTPLKARIMKFEFPFELGSSKFISPVAQRICSGLHDARKSVDKKRPAIIVAHSIMGMSNMKELLYAIAEKDAILPIANVTGLIYMECSRDTVDFARQQQTVLAASQPTKLSLRAGVSGLCDYFTLNSSSFEEDACEMEILSFFGRTNLKVLTDTAVNHSPRFCAGGKDMYYVDNAIPAAKYITAQIFNHVSEIIRVMSSQVAAAKIMAIPAYHMAASSYAVINWLSQSFQTLSPPSPSILAHTKYHGSGSWLLERPEFITWWHNDNCPIFWLSGSPGSGKSTLTSYVIQDLKSGRVYKAKRNMIVHYFCDARYRASAPTAMVLREIICELLPRQEQAHWRDRLRLALADLDDDDTKLSIGQLRSYFRDIQSAIAVGDTLILILDGLDEVGEPESSLVEELLYLVQNQDTNQRIKCFVSGNSFGNRREIVDRSKRVNLDEEAPVRRDLPYFIECEVAKIFQGSYFAQALYEKLMTRPKGIFCRAILALRGLRQIDISNEARVFSFINSIPPTLAGAYHDMLCRVPEPERKKVYRLLTIVTYTFRPLRISELLDVMDFDLREVYPGHFAKNLTLCELGGLNYAGDDILRLSGGLLIFTKDQTVQFAHNSVRDFILAQSSKSRPDSLCMGEIQAHEMLSRICLYFLQNWYGRSTADPLENTRELDTLRSEKHHDFADYALQYWSNHFKPGEAKSDHLQGLLHHLIQKKTRRSWSKYTGHSSAFTKPATQDSMSTTVCVAAKVGSVKLIQIMLEMGADPDIYIDFTGHNALHIAAFYGHLEVVNFLLKRGARVDMPSGINGRTPLQYAAAAGHTSVMSLLLDAETVSRSNWAGYAHEHTPLHTTWVVCLSDYCSFRCERMPFFGHENISTISDERHGSNVLNANVPKKDWTCGPTVRPSIGGRGGNEDAFLKVSYPRDWISKSLQQQKSRSNGEDYGSSVLKVLTQQLLQTGIDSVWQYREARKLQMPVLNHAEPVEILRARHLHLIIDAKDGNTMAQNWSKSLKIAIQRRQEDSIRLLLQNEAVALPRALSSFSTKFKSIGEKDGGNVVFGEPRKSNY